MKKKQRDYNCPQELQEPPAQPAQDGPPVPATLFPSLIAANMESLRLVRRLPQESHSAGVSAWLIGRSRLNSRRQDSHTYS
jgi:hypothetical protein